MLYFLLFTSITIVLRFVQGAWVRPAVLFGGVWALQFALLGLTMPGVQVRPAIVAYIAAASVSLGVGSQIGTPPSRAQRQSVGAARVSSTFRVVRLVPHLGLVAGIMAAFETVRSHGLDLGAVASLGGLFSTASTISVARYADPGLATGLVQPLLTLLYLSAILSPFVLVGRSARGRVSYSGLPILGAIAYSLISTQRLALILVLAMIITGHIAVHFYIWGRPPSLNIRRAGSLALVLAMVGSAFVLIAFARVGGFDTYRAEIITAKLRTYAVGQVPALSQWTDPRLDWQFPKSDLRMGADTFAGVSGVLSPAGGTRAYEERAQIGSTGQVTNIYTAFRGLLADFGAAGTLCFLALLGFSMGRIEARLRRTPSIVAALLLAAGMCFILLSPIQSPFMFTSVVVAYGLAAVVGIAAAQVRRPPASSSTSRAPCGGSRPTSKVTTSGWACRPSTTRSA